MIKVNIVPAGFRWSPFDESMPWIEVTEEECDLIRQGKLIYKNEKLIDISILNELNNQIRALKLNLSNTDYKAIKYAEGEISVEDYASIKAQREQWRKQINELELQVQEWNI